MEARRLEEEDQEALQPLRRGWCLGSEEFRQRMLGLMEGKLGENPAGELHRETAEQKGKRIIGEELARRGCQESDPAARLRKETTLPVNWIAARVQIGTTKGPKSVLNRLAQGRAARHNKTCAQLEFRSTADPFPCTQPKPHAKKNIPKKKAVLAKPHLSLWTNRNLSTNRAMPTSQQRICSPICI